MNLPRYPLTRAVVSLDLEGFGEALLRTYDPRVDLDAFARGLASAAQSRTNVVGNASELLTFATDVVGPFRVRGISRHIARDRVDARVFREFLRFVEDAAVARIALATSADEVGSLMLGAFDEVHTYVIAHDLVSKAYERVERAAAAMIESGDDDGATPPRRSPASSTQSAESNLALAA